MLQSFYPKALQIGGTLKENWFTSNDYLDLTVKYRDNAFTFSNLFPIWEFANADNFHIWFAEQFIRKNIEYGANSIFPDIKNVDDLLDLD
ncbi:MAG: hypothetical protein ACFFDF_10970 [Candidatus Odinarchaeota archaeon]